MAKDTGLIDDIFDGVGKTELPGELTVLPEGAGIQYEDRTGGCSWLLMGPFFIAVSIFFAVKVWPSAWTWACAAIAVAIAVLTAISVTIRRYVTVRPGQIIVRVQLWRYSRCRSFCVSPGQLEVYQKNSYRGVTVYGLCIRGKLFSGLPVTASKKEARLLKEIFERVLIAGTYAHTT